MAPRCNGAVCNRDGGVQRRGDSEMEKERVHNDKGARGELALSLARAYAPSAKRSAGGTLKRGNRVGWG